MKILKKNLETYLNSFSGEYKEIFFEISKNIGFTCLNGKFKTPKYSTLEGMSILSRFDKNEYFKIFSDFSDIKNKINIFKEEFSIKDSKNKISLKGEDFLKLENIRDINFDITEIIKSTNEIFEKYIKNNDFVISSEISIIFSKKSFIVGNSKEIFKKGTNFYNTYFIKLVGQKDDKKEEIYEKITGNDIQDKLDKKNIENSIKKAIKTLENQLNGISSPNGKIDVIIGNEAGGTIIHEAVGHGLEADLQNSSVYKGKIGQKVASQIVTIVDNPTIKNERGFYHIDHEGNKSQDTILIENGILKSYLHSEKTGKKFGVKSTGHARKESYKYKNLVRMGNTFLMPGKDKKENLIKKVKNGLYVSRMGGGQVNTINGDFVFKVQNGFLIENGKLTKNVIGATISGNGPEMLNEVYGICNDLNFFDGSFCGKGQLMHVSEGNPTFLTKLKVSSS